jgi:hypothetical protein
VRRNGRQSRPASPARIDDGLVDFVDPDTDRVYDGPWWDDRDAPADGYRPVTLVRLEVEA